MSIFRELTDLSKTVKSGNTVLSERLLNVCMHVIPIIEKFGTSFIMVKSDINGNIDRLEAARGRDPARFENLYAIILDEVDRGRQGDKTSDTKGLLWLNRAMQFITNLLERLFSDRAVSLSTAASDAYYATLYNYHTWYTSAAFQLALKLVPSRETFFEKLDIKGEEGMGEMHSFCATFGGIEADILRFLKDHGLDDPTPV